MMRLHRHFWILPTLVLLAVSGPLSADPPSPPPAAPPMAAPNPVPLSPIQIRQAITRALPLLTESIEGHSAARNCFTCHHHAVPVVALYQAQRKGIAVEPTAIADAIDHTQRHFEKMRSRLSKGSSPGPSPVGGATDNTGYALWMMAETAVPAGPTQTLLAEFTRNYRAASGHWPTAGRRPPSEASSFATTYVCIVGTKAYVVDESNRKSLQSRLDSAQKWLIETAATDTEDRVFRLLALHAIQAPAAAIAQAGEELRTTQQPDGGWRQLPTLSSDAYATGSALFALARTGQLSPDSKEYQRGLRFLVQSQQADGTWQVTTRSRPIQRYFESGFPYGKDQFISCAGSAWAVLALTAALPEPPSPSTVPVPAPPAAPTSAPTSAPAPTPPSGNASKSGGASGRTERGP
ncbi:hypothetical protein [Tuwongella immobilis]|uniref:Squalene cyclase C-terminal domain-containing protein n=1 Tax=Tuwongella immobilis TaxID=692036 RepID=A0A6C2YU48_9BACT|nr:hypothetical protein [Tuwongella immobilis]VIP05268.1 Hypothetical secreted protein OS=uncultured planctomycete 8FN GN=8FN_30 PE=4 SV=1: Prenyltrans_1 [Tuwongella immobilis]VTS07892.1 Hypothetical secreted protein OS=uncultured planctomycete 8FN GN=8FN_30 PE=4 SV=1: Prenyltrans_1 [Tuwongella immobilis]